MVVFRVNFIVDLGVWIRAVKMDFPFYGPRQLDGVTVQFIKKPKPSF